MKKPKALVLFSGGLDSRLTVKLLQDQNIDVETVFFQLPFGGGCCNDFWCIMNYAQGQKVKLHVVDITKPPLFNQYLKLIENPNHNYGTAMNPCKDCKIFMFKLAKKLAKKIGAEIIATGEVLQQRPMSQKKQDMLFIEKKAGLQGKVLRPLSAKLLPPTKYEKLNLFNKGKFLSIHGRQRIIQMNLAKKYKIKYPSPGGGCLLCEKEYEKKLKDFFKNKKPRQKTLPEEIQLLNIGRHFRKEGKIILGRNKEENQKLEFLNKILKYNILIPTTPGPTAIFQNKNDLKTTEKLMIAYSKGNEPMRKKFEKIKVCDSSV
jgi:tRNA-uridine 2-sulfurtransferase